MDCLIDRAAASKDHTTDYYTPTELAKKWRCSRDVVYDLLMTGKLKGFKLGHSWRISEDARLEYEQSAVAQPQVSRTHLSAKTALKIH